MNNNRSETFSKHETSVGQTNANKQYKTSSINTKTASNIVSNIKKIHINKTTQSFKTCTPITLYLNKCVFKICQNTIKIQYQNKFHKGISNFPKAVKKIFAKSSILSIFIRENLECSKI